MDLELMKKIYEFHIYGNLGFGFDGIDNYEKFSIAYHNKIKDCWYNFITNIKAKTKEEFDQIITEASTKMKEKSREVTISILPFMGEIYNKRDIFFNQNTYELVSKEAWQIYDDFNNLDKIQTNCNLKVELEKTTDMKKYSEELIKAYQTGDKEDPYGDLDPAYKEAYSNHKIAQNEYKEEFYFIKVNNEIVGITSGIYNDELYGIYGIAIKKQHRGKGIGKELIKKQLQIIKNKKIKTAFLQTEEGYYPANLYRKLGFKDICTEYLYTKK